MICVPTCLNLVVSVSVNVSYQLIFVLIMLKELAVDSFLK